jgi:hypothetical protein
MALLPPSFTFLNNHQNHADEDIPAEIWARAKANVLKVTSRDASFTYQFLILHIS